MLRIFIFYFLCIKISHILSYTQKEKIVVNMIFILVQILLNYFIFNLYTFNTHILTI